MTFDNNDDRIKCDPGQSYCFKLGATTFYCVMRDQIFEGDRFFLVICMQCERMIASRTSMPDNVARMHFNTSFSADRCPFDKPK